MFDLFYSMFWILAALFALQFLVGMVLTARISNRIDKAAKKIQSVSVIIPFRNESSRIQGLIESLNKQRLENKFIEFIWVDDCSDDATADLLETRLKIPYSMIRLNQKSGKKTALHRGIQQAQSDFILTLDADVELPENYFDHLFQLPESEMVILPVKMGGKKMIQHLAAIEFGWLQILAFGSLKPVLCNGANLLFRKAAYLNVYQTRNDFDIASGDDVFLLSAFLRYNYRITRMYEEELTVNTPAPVNSIELFQQRRRWISKLSRMNDNGSYLALVFLVLIQSGFVFSLIAVFFNPLYLFIITLKIITEFMLAASAAQSDLRSAFVTTVVHQVWYPFYLILLLFPVNREERWEQETTEK